MASAARDCTEEFEAAVRLEQREAPRFTALIRAAKLVYGGHEFVCVLRDVSSVGVRLRLFHPIPRETPCLLALENGEAFALQWVREDEEGTSFRFAEATPVERLVNETCAFPRRQLRLAVKVPLRLRTLAGHVAATSENISQQGCRLISTAPLALAQPVIVEHPRITPIRAKVRWRRDGACGLVFDDTFSLADLARAAALLQTGTLSAR